MTSALLWSTGAAPAGRRSRSRPAAPPSPRIRVTVSTLELGDIVCSICEIRSVPEAVLRSAARREAGHLFRSCELVEPVMSQTCERPRPPVMIWASLFPGAGTGRVRAHPANDGDGGLPPPSRSPGGTHLGYRCYGSTGSTGPGSAGVGRMPRRRIDHDPEPACAPVSEKVSAAYTARASPARINRIATTMSTVTSEVVTPGARSGGQQAPGESG